MSERRVVPIGEAIARLGDSPEIHTFVQSANGELLIGACHSRESLITLMRKYTIEEAGDTATTMGHSLVLINYKPSPLFIKAKSHGDI